MGDSMSTNKNNLYYAPVFLSVYNRFDHLKKCLISLSNCDGANQTVLYVTSDGPKDKKDIKKILEIREFIRSFKGFKEIITIFPQENTKKRIITETYNIIFSKYDKLIRTEDDNIFSKNFLEFVNQGLEVYYDNNNVYSISGYGFPIKIPKSYNKDVYFWKGYVAWGVGLWKHKTLIENKTLQVAEELISNHKRVQEMKLLSENNFYHVRNMCKTKKRAGDALVVAHMLMNDMYSVFPVESRVKNIGFDGSGMNCGKSKIDQEKYHKQKISDNINTVSFPEKIIESSVINKLMRKYSKVPLRRKLRRMFNNLKNKFIICIL